MSSWVEKKVRVIGALALGAAMLSAQAVHAQAQQGQRFPGIGRAATPAEVAAWDIDVRPDFKGLPKGSGSVNKGQEVWEGKCASCHGIFGESNEVFSPLVGGTTAKDIETGRVANLMRADYPGRTTLMKVATVSTLWDYINRAMPWNAPKSLTTEEVYAVTAFLLNLGQVVPDDFVLSDTNIADVQKRMPNRNGFTTAHGMWPGKEFKGTGKPDVNGTACMKDCAVEAKVASMLPDFARNAHGNLAEQNRLVGAQHGADTTRPPGAAPATARPAAAPAPAAPAAGKAPTALLQKNTCTACHAPAAKLVGPSWADVAKKHAGKADYLADKIRSGGQGVWGNIPMPPQTLSAEEARTIANWLATGAAP
ncbi:c-type cytochrome [Ramlibacter sp.]|uniref:c-type cytochrome n=1 Tax=Ramlibacter sp. TaxID=1917967 RepID=UPI0035B1DF35